jgi:precorrin-4/cobalt-precorrin-4 C11-methyltransferase
MKVYFLGAGPGDPELITVKGKRLLESADLVIYADSLVNPDLLKWTREGAELVGSSEKGLEEIVSLMAEAWRAGKLVVRLVSGDPALYSAVNEQAEMLDSLGIPWEIVPGVSSLSAAAAVLGVELTCPGLSQAVVLARMEGKTPLPRGFRLRDVLHPQATNAIFLSAGLADGLLEEFLASGFDPAFPAAAVHRASWRDQRTLLTPLSNLPSALEDAGMRRQTLILVGDILSDEKRRHRRSVLYSQGPGPRW